MQIGEVPRPFREGLQRAVGVSLAASRGSDPVADGRSTLVPVTKPQPDLPHAFFVRLDRERVADTLRCPLVLPDQPRAGEPGISDDGNGGDVGDRTIEGRLQHGIDVRFLERSENDLGTLYPRNAES